jgi:hypothetical protein
MIADKKQFLVLLAWMAQAFKEEMSKERAKIYYDFLKSYHIEKIREAFESCISSLKFFPKISEILEQMNPQPDLSYWPSFDDKPMIEHKEPYNPLDKEEAKDFISKITNEIDNQENKEKEEREKRFIERKKTLEEQKRILGLA